LKELLGAKYLSYISSLTNTRWILPVGGFRGIYYVLDPEERQKKTFKLSKFQILIIVLDRILDGDWYFGRITALHLHGAIHQPVSTHYILNQKYSRKVRSKMLGELVFVKTSGNINKHSGIITMAYKGRPYNLSTIERTITDYIYLYLHGHTSRTALIKLQNSVHFDKNKLVRIISAGYPKYDAKRMHSLIEHRTVVR